MKKYATTDDYLETVEPTKRAALEKLRGSIQKILPHATECISYGMPAFKQDGKVLVYFAAAKKHCAFYPTSRPIAVHAEELKKFDVSKGTIRFQPEKPLSQNLIRALVKTRLMQIEKTKK